MGEQKLKRKRRSGTAATAAILIAALALIVYNAGPVQSTRRTRIPKHPRGVELRFAPLPTFKEAVIPAPPAEILSPATPGDIGAGEQPDPQAYLMSLNQQKWDYVMQEILRQEQIRRDQYEEWRKREQCRIYCERYNSPLAPYTQLMQDEAARVGSTIYMCPAVAYKESSMCHACFRPFNGWGLMGYWPSSWEEGIHDFYQFLWDWNISRGYAAVSGMTTPNYCVPWPGSWAPEVDAHLREIQAIEVAPYNPNL